jgi:1-aminocyclopropane-1-carboxylate deaminase
LIGTKTDTLTLDNHLFYVKRDDLISPYFSGNKYRKLYCLLKTAADTYTTLYSYGGNQSNAMVSIAHLCHQKGWKFIYLTKQLPKWLKDNPQGNLKEALLVGMQLEEVHPLVYDEKVQALLKLKQPSTLVVPQGGAFEGAQEGIERLANEVYLWYQKQNFKTLSIVTPSGTGTTALYLSLFFADKDEIKVYTTPSVGDEDYLIAQWKQLSSESTKFPQLLYTHKKYRFGSLYKAYLDIYNRLLEQDIEFDLLYAPKMWLALLENLPKLQDTPILYIHSGGVGGNYTLLERYKHKKLL